MFSRITDFFSVAIPATLLGAITLGAASVPVLIILDWAGVL